MSRLILQLDPSEPKLWVAQQRRTSPGGEAPPTDGFPVHEGATRQVNPPNAQTQATQPVTHNGFTVLGEALDKDGVGIGIGIATLVFFGTLASVVAWALLQLVKNLNPAKIAIEVSQYIKETECKLERIDANTADSDRKIELLTSIAEKNAAMLREARAAGLEMSGQLHQIQRTVDNAIKSEIAKK